jgi:hypothetical protein
MFADRYDLLMKADKYSMSSELKTADFDGFEFFLDDGSALMGR